MKREQKQIERARDKGYFSTDIISFSRKKKQLQNNIRRFQ